jgi:hypothetical protein
MGRENPRKTSVRITGAPARIEKAPEFKSEALPLHQSVRDFVMEKPILAPVERNSPPFKELEITLPC